MPPRTEAQRRAMAAAAAGKGRLGIPGKVATEFMEADPGGRLPERKKKSPAHEGQRRVLGAMRRAAEVRR
jgi:hypothetical protein